MDLEALSIHKADAAHKSLVISPGSMLNITAQQKGGRGSQHFQGKPLAKYLSISLDGALEDIPIIYAGDSQALRHSVLKTGVV